MESIRFSLTSLFVGIDQYKLAEPADQLAKQMSSILCLLGVNHRVVMSTHKDVAVEFQLLSYPYDASVGPKIEIFEDGSCLYDGQSIGGLAETFPWERFIGEVEKIT